MNLFNEEIIKNSSSSARCIFSDSPMFSFEGSLLSLQKNSFDSFIGAKDSRLSNLLANFMPIYNSSKNLSVEFKKCYLGSKTSLSVQECLSRGESYVAPMFGLFSLKTPSGELRDQEIYMGELPIITPSGSFVINGIERVVVSQLHRSPGIVYMADNVKGHSSEKLVHSCRFIPYRGSWLDIEFDFRDTLHVRIDKKRKILLSTFLMAMGVLVDNKKIGFCDITSYEYIEKDGVLTQNITKSIVLKSFYRYEKISFSDDKITSVGLKSLKGFIAPCDIKSAKIKRSDLIGDIKGKISLPGELFLGSCFASDVVDSETGEVLFFAGDLIDKDILSYLCENNIDADIIIKDIIDASNYIFNTVCMDKNNSTEEALNAVYMSMRPGDSPNLSASKEMFMSFFFDKQKYDLSGVGRIKINESLGSNIDESVTVLTVECILRSVINLIKIKNGHDVVDNIDALHFRRVKSIGEFLESQCFAALTKIEKNIVDSLNMCDDQSVVCSDIIPIGLFD